MRASVIPQQDITTLETDVLDNQGRLQVVPAEVYRRYTQEQISILCLKRAFYGLPTKELIEWLEEQIGPFKKRTIEIGAGNGVIGRELGIRMTDSFMQLRPDIKKRYLQSKQPIITYGDDVHKIDANKAVKRLKPRIVIASWVTQLWQPGDEDGNQWGIDEEKILKRVKKYIHIGHRGTHGSKKILRKSHKTYKFPWLFSRSMNVGGCLIYVWERR